MIKKKNDEGKDMEKYGEETEVVKISKAIGVGRNNCSRPLYLSRGGMLGHHHIIQSSYTDSVTQ